MDQIYCWKCGRSFDFYLDRCPHCKTDASKDKDKIASNAKKPWKRLSLLLVIVMLALNLMVKNGLSLQYENGYNSGYNLGLAEGKKSKSSSLFEYTEEDLEFETKKAYNRGYAAGQAATPSAPSTKSSSINEYSGDIEAILDYIHDNPHEFYLYDDRDMELAYAQGYEDGLYDR